MRRLFLLSGLFLLLTACSSTPVQLYPGAERPASDIATLRVPIEVEVHSINGKQLDTLPTILGTDDRQLELLPGSYKLLVFYNNIWQINADEHTTIKSQPVAINLQLQAGHTYQLDFAHAHSYNEAKHFKDRFQPWVTDQQTGDKVTSHSSGLKFGGNFIEQMTGQGKLVNVGKKDTEGHQIIAPLTTATATTTTAAAKAAQASATGSDDAKSNDNTTPSSADAPPAQSGSYLNLLKAQWGQASQAEKRAFLEWVSTHP